MPGADVGIFSAQISFHRTSIMEQSTPFPQIIRSLSYPIENSRISRNPRQVLAASTGSSSTSSVQPDKHPNVLHLLLVVNIYVLCTRVALWSGLSGSAQQMCLVLCGCFNSPVRMDQPTSALSLCPLVFLPLK